MKIKEISFQESLKLKNQCKLLLITATDIEKQEVLKSLTPCGNKDHVFEVRKGTSTYYLGNFGAYGAILVKSGMGTGTAGGSTITTTQAINTWQPKAIVMIGIAFGIDRKKQRIGDVLVAEQIIPYDVRREGKFITIYRSAHPPSSPFLQNRFAQVMGWSFKLPGGEKAKFCLCPILSGEVLIDNKAFRDALLKAFPKAKGGEMEAAGVYVAASQEKIDWIVVKAICDFADGNKGKNKKINQNIAVRSATSLAKKVFSSQYAFTDLGLIPAKADTSIETTSDITFIKISKQKREHLKNLISTNEVEKAFTMLKKMLKEEHDNDYYDELIMLQQDYNANRSRERMNTVSVDKLREGDNQIAYRLLKLIDQLHN